MLKVRCSVFRVWGSGFRVRIRVEGRGLLLRVYGSRLSVKYSNVAFAINGSMCRVCGGGAHEGEKPATPGDMPPGVGDYCSGFTVCDSRLSVEYLG